MYPSSHSQNIPDHDFFDDHQKVLLIRYLIDPVIKKGKKGKRLRHNPTWMKILCLLYQLSKKVKRGDWEQIAPGKQSLARWVGCSVKSVTEFITGEGKVFFKVIGRPGATNIYILEEWVRDVLHFMEAKGMMKGFKEDYEKWRGTFVRRLKFWLLPLLEKGHCLKVILMNKLSTKSNLKSANQPPLKGARMEPLGVDEAFQGSRHKNEDDLPVFFWLKDLRKRLKYRGLQDGDVNSFLKRYSPQHNMRAMSKMEYWYRSGIEPGSPVRIYQACINQTR